MILRINLKENTKILICFDIIIKKGGCLVKKLKLMLITFIAGVIVGVFLYSQNKWIFTEQITIHSSQLPQNFNEFKIVHLSDLHGQSFG